MHLLQSRQLNWLTQELCRDGDLEEHVMDRAASLTGRAVFVFMDVRRIEGAPMSFGAFGAMTKKCLVDFGCEDACFNHL